jgi:hypothetical protein
MASAQNGQQRSTQKEKDYETETSLRKRIHWQPDLSCGSHKPPAIHNKSPDLVGETVKFVSESV